MPTRRALLTVALALAAAKANATAADEAAAFIDHLGQRTIEALNRVGHDAQARQQAIAALLDEATDLTLIARLCLGRHWRTASEAQRAEYVALFALTCWRSCRGG
jgi:phospholipid transport system substrate-binding protein